MSDDGRHVITLGAPDQLQGRPDENARSRYQPCEHGGPDVEPLDGGLTLLLVLAASRTALYRASSRD
ncbi:hypothetical protein ACFRH4_43710 [Streptomyces mirabilis]|uniref:hypothetical protein n=1 Tax=Streptomyces mirabilis TaxID=68239 RepID=UPI003676429D